MNTIPAINRLEVNKSVPRQHKKGPSLIVIQEETKPLKEEDVQEKGEMENQHGGMNRPGEGETGAEVLQGAASAGGNYYQVEGSVHLRLQSSQMFKLFGFISVFFFGIICFMMLKITTLETKFILVQFELETIRNTKCPQQVLPLPMQSSNLEDQQQVVDTDATLKSSIQVLSVEEDADMSSLSLESAPGPLVHFKRMKRDVLSEEEMLVENSTSDNSTELERMGKQLGVGRGRGRPNGNGGTGTAGRKGNHKGKAAADNQTCRLRLHRCQTRRNEEKYRRLQWKDKLVTSRVRVANLTNALHLLAQKSEIRAAYLRPGARIIDITENNQIIGPWHLPFDEKRFGFNALWYSELDFNENSTSIIFKENGLYSITSQLFYHLNTEKSLPVGYKILIKKKQPSPFLKPLAVAECATSFPARQATTQTCLTTVTWYMEKGDEIFLQHSQISKPFIEADPLGKTFLQIIRLAG